MILNEKYCSLIDSDNGYDNQLLADCCEKIADEFAIAFAEWMSKFNFMPNKGWYVTSYEIEMNTFKTSKELLEIYKKKKNL